MSERRCFEPGSKAWLRVALFMLFVAALFWMLTALFAPAARADHGGPMFEHECPTDLGDPRGWPCTHTMLNGQKFIDWSSAYIDDRNYPMVPVEVP